MKNPNSANLPGEKTTRPPLERMLRIHDEIRGGKFPNAGQLAALLEVTVKTVYRDVDFMRDRLSLPIYYDKPHNGYGYTEEVAAFPTAQITEGELFALLLAEKALEQYRGTNFEKPLLSAIRKLESSLPDTITLNFADLDRTISFRTRAEPILDLGIFRTLADAAMHRRQLRIVYRKPGAQPVSREVDPYHLANINGEWFLFAYDHLRGEQRTFAPGRIQSAEPTGKHFPAPAKFSLEQRLRGSFGVHAGKESHEVVIRFAPGAAEFIREKKWHDSQKLRELRDGGAEITLTLSSLAEIERWVLQWGGQARVVKPKELADAVQAAAKKILED